MSRASAGLLIIGVLAAPPRTAGQEGITDELERHLAYSAIITTPLGAMGPAAPEILARPSGPRLALRYGHMSEPYSDEETQHGMGVDAGFAFGGGRLQASAGRVLVCDPGDPCFGRWVAAVTWDMSLWRIDDGAAFFSVGLRPGYGMTIPEADRHNEVMAAQLGAPMAVAVGADRRVVLYAVPALAWGRMSNDRSIAKESPSAFRPMLGGGVSVFAREGLVVTASLQKVFIQYGKTQLGVGLGWQPGRR